MKTRLQHIRVDRATLAADDASAAIEPVWWTANIYGSPQEYESSLAPFSRPQRCLFAVQWYRAEVNNGGHDQFYSNSTGIVWRDALSGFELLGLEDFAAVLRESATRLGGDPALDRTTRQAALERLRPDFEDLDTRFYGLEHKTNLDATLLTFMREHLDEFEFDGMVNKPVPHGE